MNEPRARLTFASGGWVIAVSGILVAAVVVWSMAGLLLGHRRIGDGATVESYGFDLSNLRAPREALAASGLPRDGLRALEFPETIDGRDVPQANAERRRKVVVATDRVVGVVVGGVARAYPLRILNAHEVVNDVLADVPIAVSYSPLSDSAVVLDRNVAGAERRFGVSGLLLNSNLVFFDRGETPSLWSQIGLEAIAGPLAGTRLEPLPDVNVTTWASWLARHPDTSVITGDPDSGRLYANTSYTRYFGDTGLLFPIERQPDANELARDGLTLKSAVIAIRDPRTPGEGAKWMVVPTRSLLERLGKDGEGEIEVDGLRLRVALSSPNTVSEPIGVLLEAADGSPLVTIPALWFAWHAFHPDAAPVRITK